MVPDDKIIDAIRRRHPRDREFQISRTIPKFFSGELVVVDVLKDKQPTAENYAYVSFDQITATFLSMDDLAAWVSARSRNRGSGVSLLSVEAISGFIAILITVTICVIVFKSLDGPSEVRIPDILSNALTTILGFYFGSQVSKAVTSHKKSSEDAHKAPEGP